MEKTREKDSINWKELTKENLLFYRESYFKFIDSFGIYEYDHSYIRNFWHFFRLGIYQHDLLSHMIIKPAESDATKVSFFSSPEKRKAGIRTVMKPGKFLGFVDPYANNKNKEDFTKAWILKYGPKDYSLHVSKDISKVYQMPQFTGPTPDLNSGYVEEIKLLSASCMRHNPEYWNLPSGYHPTQVYESGDFDIVYVTENKTGGLVARCLIGNDSAGPVYTNCDYATKMIDQYLKENGIESCENWEGLRLNKIRPWNDKRVLVAYVDSYDKGEDCGEYFRILDKYSDDYDVVISSTGGYANLVEKCNCSRCEDKVFESDLREAILSNGDSGSICYYCRNESDSFVYLYQEEVYCHTDQIGDIEGEYSLNYIQDNPSKFVLYDGDYYHVNHSSIANVDGKYYHKDSDEYEEAIKKEKEKLGAYQTIITCERVWEHSFEYSFSKLKTPALIWKMTETIVLRENYQINELGQPERLPELPF